MKRAYEHEKKTGSSEAKSLNEKNNNHISINGDKIYFPIEQLT